MIDRARTQRAALEAGLGAAAVSLIELDAAGERLAAGPSGELYPASMIKTPLAVAAAVAVSSGRIRWDDLVTVEQGVMTVNDAPSPLQPGASATVAELLELMLSRSDNVATNMLVDCLGRERATADLTALGFLATGIRRKVSGALPLIDDPGATGRNTHPADEAAELFARLAAGRLPDAGRILRALAAQYWNSKLPAGLEPGDRFAHKTGDTDEVSHDGGVLTLASGERYVVVVYTQLPSDDDTDRRFADFMRVLRPTLRRPGT